MTSGDDRHIVKRLLDVREVAHALGCGRTYVYELINRGEPRALKLDRLTRVQVTELERYIAEKARQ